MDNKTITKNKSEFPNLLKNAINKCSIENASNTPDYILTEFLLSCLNAYEVAVIRRDQQTEDSKEKEYEVKKVSDGYFIKEQKKPQKIGNSSANILGT
jgi:hypothetical protein